MTPPAPRTAEEAILGRRSARRFDPDRPVPPALLRRILELATHAPSSFNLQPWRFLVVRERRNRDRLRACAYGQPKLAHAPAIVVLMADLYPERVALDAVLESQQAAGVFDATKAAEIRFRVGRDLGQLSDDDRRVWATRSTMLAGATLMLAAEGLGLATAPLEGFDEARLRDAFGIPDDHLPCLLVGLGYAAESQPFAGRLELDSVCHAEHFGAPWGDGDGPLDSAPPTL